MHALAARQFPFNPKNRNTGYCAATIEKFLENLCGIQYPEARFDLQIPHSVTTDSLVTVHVYYLQWVKRYKPLPVHSLKPIHSGIRNLNNTHPFRKT